MSVFINDTARNNLASWTERAIRGNYAIGAYINPFTSSQDGFKSNPSALAKATKIHDAGGEFWFDPMTHAFDMPRQPSFDHYDTWELWEGSRGALDNDESMKGHTKHVFAIQDALGAPALAPTCLVSYPDSPKSQHALRLSQIAMEENPRSWLSIAGDTAFWTAGAELDAHIGALDQLEPAGWLLTVTRSDNAMPPLCTPEEIFGIMRTVFALSQDRPVRIAYGDVAALPAVAAGAEAIGTGWDLRQRICAYTDFQKSSSDSKGGSWYQRPTLKGLMGGLSSSEYTVLVSEDPSLASRLAPGVIGNKPEQAFAHHASYLTQVTHSLSLVDNRTGIENLRNLYIDAKAEWPKILDVTSAKLGSDRWINPFLEGIDLFRASEGWIGK